MSKKKNKKKTEEDSELSASAAFFKKRSKRAKQVEEEEVNVEASASDDTELLVSDDVAAEEVAAAEDNDTTESDGDVIKKILADSETDELSFLDDEDDGELRANASEAADDDGEQTDDEHTDEGTDAEMDLTGTELENFEAADLGDTETLAPEQIRSIVESVLFATDKPISVAVIKQSFKGTNVRSKDIREALHELQRDYLESVRGFTLDEVGGGFQLRTKPDNMKYLRQSVKARPFKVSGPALEVLSIVAYKQPTTKHQIDEIRGVESGHLLRALMEKGLLTFGERSELPGKPMFYETTRKFLEIFGLRNLQELPSLHEIDQLIPEGIGEPEKKETLGDLTQELSEEVSSSYSVGEEELLKITDELSQITTSSEFFEQEKQRMRAKRDQERAQDIREALTVGEKVEDKDLKWLERYEKGLLEAAQAEKEVEFVTEENPAVEEIVEHEIDASDEVQI